MPLLSVHSLLSVHQAAKWLGVPPSRFYQMARDGIVPVVRLGRQVRVDRETLEAWIREGGTALSGGWRKQATPD